MANSITAPTGVIPFDTPTLGGTCCVVSHKRFFRVGGRYCSQGGFNRYVEVIRAMFDRVLLAVPVEHDAPPDDVTPIADGVAEFVELPSYYTRHRYPIQWLSHPAAFVRPLARAARRADVVHVIFPGYVQVYGLAVARWLRRPHFCSVVGDWEAEYAVSSMARSHPVLIKPLVAAHRILTRWTLRSPLVFVHGTAMAERLGRAGGNVVPNQSSTFSERDIRASETLGPVHQPARILFVGRLDYKKGVPTLLEAIKKLHEDGDDAVLTVVGGGPNAEEFERLAARLGVQDHVTFKGHVKDAAHLRELYRQHDLFALPSLTEGAPKVVIEAYAQGLPVVATRVGGIPGMVSDKNGLLIEPGEPAQLAEAIRRILRDDVYRLALARYNLIEARTKTMEAQVRHMTGHIRRRMPELFGRCAHNQNTSQGNEPNDVV